MFPVENVPGLRSATRLCLAGLIALCAVVLSAGARAQPEVPGGRDFPLIKRYEGSRLVGYETKAFTSFKLLLGKLKLGDNGQAAVDAGRTIEGKHTRLLYLAPPQRSSLEVFRNYEADLAAKGFTVLFKCSGEDECESFGTEIYRVLYPPTGALQNNELSKVAFNVPAEPRYLAATLARPEGDVFVSLYVAVERGDAFPQTKDRAAVLLDVVETRPMDSKMVTVDATAMAKDIAATGKVALYGLYFDTDKAELKAESAPSLAEIAKLLKGQPGLKVFIVGHTDNVGGYDYNMGLSQRRAKSVVDRLVQQHGIVADRLKPVGAGLIAPVASNDDESGRAKNRRVEIVKE
ncbi:MAG: OmpA family protein [Reyranella sp.]|uniref:OmpA family protein n=1 Tax=Reyranella sp. TaxID=1929291 RepID=UPI003D0D1820